MKQFNFSKINLLIKTPETDQRRKIILFLIDNSPQLHLDQVVETLKTHPAVEEMVHVYLRMGVYHEAFSLSIQQQKLHLVKIRIPYSLFILKMIQTLKACKEDSEQFVDMFSRFIEYVKNQNIKLDEDLLLFFLEKHPNVTEFIDIIPKKWMKSQQFMDCLMDKVESLKLEASILSKTTNILEEEIAKEVDKYYLGVYKTGKTMIKEQCQLCNQTINLTQKKSKEKELVQFFNCSHAFHFSCFEKSSPFATDELDCPLCKWN